jgi:nicotinate-nucleotide adenylyltransferase
MNIAIFGGSFDPPHIGHEQIINKSLEVLDIDKLFIVPTFLNPFKTTFYFSPKDRFNLLKECFIDDKIVISDFEILKLAPVATITTVEYFYQTMKPSKIYLIIGADNLEKLHLWEGFSKLKTLVSFVVISREGNRLKNDIIHFTNIDMNLNISSTAIRKNLDLKYIPKKIQQKVKKLWKIE